MVTQTAQTEFATKADLGVSEQRLKRQFQQMLWTAEKRRLLEAERAKVRTLEKAYFGSIAVFAIVMVSVSIIIRLT